MIRINLLPHRELKRQARRRQFGILCGVSAGIGAAIVAAVGVFITGQISSQRDVNAFIERENKKLDDDIKEIAKLEDEIRGLRARQKAVEDLQGDRNLPVHLLDELVKVTPDGIYLRSLRQSGARVTINGLAANNAKVADYVRNLTRNVWLAAPELVEIKAVVVGAGGAAKRLNEFTMNISIVRPKDPAPGAPGAPPAASSPLPGAAPAPASPAPAKAPAAPGKA
ncbi:MAG: PilN domain-containing protein [Burkholderiales bacterium]|nr:PilN domain-containing protein [Burkholderiales bacterium]